MIKTYLLAIYDMQPSEKLSGISFPWFFTVFFFCFVFQRVCLSVGVIWFKLTSFCSVAATLVQIKVSPLLTTLFKQQITYTLVQISVFWKVVYFFIDDILNTVWPANVLLAFGPDLCLQQVIIDWSLTFSWRDLPSSHCTNSVLRGQLHGCGCISQHVLCLSPVSSPVQHLFIHWAGNGSRTNRFRCVLVDKVKQAGGAATEPSDGTTLHIELPFQSAVIYDSGKDKKLC